MNQALNNILSKFRASAKTEREKGTYFEELIQTYFRNEAAYKDLYSHVWTYAEWAKEYGVDGKDVGIDLVAKTNGTEEYHAIQCKFYDEGYTVQKKDIDSFFTASGKKPFTHRIIVTTTDKWSNNAEDALRDQTPPVTKIDLYTLAKSQIDWSKYDPKKAVVLKPKKELRPHQEKALKDVESGLASAERGKLIMACGTGKTFTALKVAEKLAGKGKRVLFLVPSLSLLSQTLTEWTQESKTPLHSFAVCSDSDIGKKRGQDEIVAAHELEYPATTDAKSLAREVDKLHDKNHMSVVFSTYHSIDVIGAAQKKHDLADFDLIICDEAHRTTGATFADEQDDESSFVKIHDNKNVKGKKRLYMTATPRIYADVAEAKAEKDGTVLYSMNNEAYYGKELHVLTFSEAVMRGLLVDYKVIVLAMDEGHVSARVQRALKDENNQLRVDDAAKIIGCWKALSKQHQDDPTDDRDPMRRAVAFCQVIEQQKGAKVHKVSSKNIAAMFQTVVEEYQEQEEDHNTLKCEAEHIDGGMNASEKEKKLQWLKDNAPEDTCRILSNVRCLSEGVDVPALDAVLFLTPRNSQVDVVQSVGRIMRNAPGKKRGYVILPVVIPNDKTPEEALNDNKTYKVVWEVLQALRSHDDRFDAMINKFDLVGKDHSKMEVIAVTDKVHKKQKSEKKNTGRGSSVIGAPVLAPPKPEQLNIQFQIGEIERALYAKMVQKCGNRIFPSDEEINVAIAVSGVGSKSGFTSLMINAVPSLDTVEKGQCFPLYLYDHQENGDGGLFAGKGGGRKDGITDAGLAHFKAAYPGEKINKEDVFYYIYGILHSEEYREKYADNLSKQLPRIPCVKQAADFWAFSKAGRALGDLHVGYETVKPYDVTLDTGSRKLKDFGENEYYVTKMKFAKKGDKSTVIYNDFITIRDIPLDAYDYVVNGKPALEWVMERQGVKTDKDSGIVNDANLYATETVGDPAYPLKLFQRIITVSLETMKIVRSLPKLDIQAPKKEKAA